MKRHKLLTINVDSIGPEEIYDKILSLMSLDRPSHIVLLDTYLLMKAQFSRELFIVINTADLVIPISRGIKRGLKFLRKDVEKVYNYYNFLITLLLKFTEESKFVYILGGQKENIEKAERNLRDSFPGIRLVGRFHTQYKKNFEKDLIMAIKKASPALVLVGKKSPKQEKWIYRNKKAFNSGVFIGVGDFINIVGGKGRSPSSRSTQAGTFAGKKIFKNPLRIYRLFYYILYGFLLLLSKIFNKY